MASLKDLQPKIHCPKCGEGRFELPPRYEFDSYDYSNNYEHLYWRCDYCGYEIKTKTLDNYK